MTNWINRAAVAVMVLLVAGGFYLALRDPPILAETAQVVIAPMTVTIDQEGTTRVRDVYAVSSPISGHLARTPLEVGDSVKAGKTVIAAIHPLDPPLIDRRTEAELRAAADAARAAVALAEAEFNRVQTELSLARSALERATRLSASSTISERAMEQAAADVSISEAQLQSAQANIALRRAELASAEVRLMQPTQLASDDEKSGCCVQITAPVDGTVLEISAKSEQAVTPGTLIAEIGDPKDIEIVVDLLSADAISIRPGQKAELIDWGGGHNLTATVRRVDPAAFTKVSALGIEEQRVNVVFDLDQPAAELGHGFRVYARIAIWQSDNVLQIPISAIFRSQGEWAAFRVDDNMTKLVKLKLGHMNNETAEVLAGLAAGDLVVTHPSDTLSDGSEIELRSLQQTGQ